MKPYYSDDWLTVYQGDCREVMASMEPESVHCVVTSPPYWGLRDYGTATWIGGDEGCDHRKVSPGTASIAKSGLQGGQKTNGHQQEGFGAACGKCGATRQDSQLGLEPTPEAYVANMVAVFREVRRVLRADGTVWLNLGDSYNNADKWGGGGANTGKHTKAPDGSVPSWAGVRRKWAALPGLKPKDLVGIPWMVARALQAPYYTGRIPRERDRVWMAAMIDGEGTICGFDHDRADGAGHRSGVHVAMTNTSTALLDEMARIWPTSRSEHQRPTAGHLGTKTSWRWLVHGIENKQAALRELYPYLIAKRQQAVVAYTLLDLMANAKRLGHSPQKDATMAKRAVLTGLLSDLNHQRPVTLPSWLIEPATMLEPGWYLRSDIIWAKPNPMPESITDRPTKAHEYLFLLSKSARYFYDADAVREVGTWQRENNPAWADQRAETNAKKHPSNRNAQSGGFTGWSPEAGRNLRSVWTVATQPYPGAHFATFPEKLVEPCIKAGTSERGVCPECGASIRQEVIRRPSVPQRQNYHGADDVGRHRGGAGRAGGFYPERSTTVQVRDNCPHNTNPVPAVVLDPFAGSGTVGRVAQRLSRRAVLIDLNADYLVQAMARNASIPLGLESA